MTAAQPHTIIIPHMLSQHDSSMGIHQGKLQIIEYGGDKTDNFDLAT